MRYDLEGWTAQYLQRRNQGRPGTGLSLKTSQLAMNRWFTDVLDFTTKFYKRNNLHVVDFSQMSNLTIARNTVAYARNLNETWQSFAANKLRFVDRGVLVEEPRTEAIRNSTGAGGVAPSTFPTNWVASSSGGTGISTTYVGAGTEFGLPYVDVRLAGTVSGGAQNPSLAFESSTGIDALTAQVWAVSVFSRIVGGSGAGISGFFLRTTERTAAGGFVAQQSVTLAVPTAALSRSTQIATLAGGGTVAKMTPSVVLTIPDGQTVDATLRLYVPNAQLGSSIIAPIITNGATLIKPADILSLNNLSFYSTISFVVDMEWFMTADGTDKRITLSDGTANNRIVVLRNTSNSAGFAVSIFGATVFSGVVVGKNGARRIKFAITYDGIQYRAAVDGVLLTPGAAAFPIGLNKLEFGGAAGAGPYPNAYFHKIALGDKPMSNAELQAATL